MVNYNGASFIERCLESVLTQTLGPLDVTVYDNGSTDASVALVQTQAPRVGLVCLGQNRGFAGAANEGIRRSRSPYVLLLNPDACLGPDYVEAVHDAAESDGRIGSVTGKLLRFSEPAGRRLIDSTGHILFRNRWVLNRGEEEIDDGQYDEPGEIFGVCGAAALYRREMLEDVRVGEEYLAEAFFTYLEDVDLDWRAQLRGWKAYYVPSAIAHHERGHKGKRRTRSPFVLRHSLKNRYLLMLRNDRWADALRDLPAILTMEVIRLLDYAVTQPSALLGYLDVVPLLPHALAERRHIQGRRCVPPAHVRRWLHAYPYRRKLREKLGGALAGVRGERVGARWP